MCVCVCVCLFVCPLTCIFVICAHGLGCVGDAAVLQREREVSVCCVLLFSSTLLCCFARDCYDWDCSSETLWVRLGQTE